MKIDFANLKKSHQAHQDEIEKAINEVIAKADFIMGEEVGLLETELASFIGKPYAITCSSGTSALLLALLAMGIKRGDEVITSAFSFISAAEMIALLGAKPVFVDINPRTFNLEPSLLELAITKKTKAIIPVSLFGLPSDMDAINQIAKNHNLIVIEDGAQSFGATYRGKKSCNLSPVSITSFFPAKPLGCYGDGGAVFCDDETIAQKIKSLRTHGQTKRYTHSYIGITARLDTLQAAILRVKLKYYPDAISQRQKVAKIYENHLQSKSTLPPYIPQDSQSIYAQYCILSPQRKTLEERFKKCHIPYAIHYPKPLPLQQCFGYLGYGDNDFKAAQNISQSILSLPMNPYLSEEEINYICEQID